MGEDHHNMHEELQHGEMLNSHRIWSLVNLLRDILIVHVKAKKQFQIKRSFVLRTLCPGYSTIDR